MAKQKEVFEVTMQHEDLHDLLARCDYEGRYKTVYTSAYSEKQAERFAKHRFPNWTVVRVVRRIRGLTE